MKATKISPEKALIYVAPPELELYSRLPSYLRRRLDIEAVVYATDDPTTYDPGNRAKAARMGRPGIHLE